MLECVPNVSEGQDQSVLDRLAEACGRSLLDRHVDADHNRSVFTLAGPGPTDAADAARRLAGAVAGVLDLRSHGGVHPRFGALDVVPFVALEPTVAARSEAVQAARSFAEWWSGTFGVPVFRYDDADPAGRSLPRTRREAFVERDPDTGPRRPHPTLGATAVGARRPMVALNCLLRSGDVAAAARIARAVRERDGGLAGVRSLGFFLDGPKLAQVSMNLVDLDRTGIEEACRTVRTLARAEGTEVGGVELVGLLPASELGRCSDEFLAWSGLSADQTIEARLAAVGANDASDRPNRSDRPDRRDPTS